MAYPISFVLRRVGYAIVILFLTHLPYMSVVILMSSCITMLALVYSEAPWEASIINLQHAVNEVAFYLVLCHVIIFCGLF